MFDDFMAFGWQYIKEVYMPNGIIRRYFQYMKALKIIYRDIAKEYKASSDFENKVHAKTRTQVPTGNRRVTIIREVLLPKGAEDEVFDYS